MHTGYLLARLEQELDELKRASKQRIDAIHAAVLDVYSKTNISELDDDGFACAINLHIILLSQSEGPNRQRHEEKFRQYLQASPQRLDLCSPITQLSALETAIKLKDLSIVKQLMAAQATPTLRACMLAMCCNCDDILAELLQKTETDDELLIKLLNYAAENLTAGSYQQGCAASIAVGTVIFDKMSWGKIKDEINDAIRNSRSDKLQWLIGYCIAKSKYAELYQCLEAISNEANNSDSLLYKLTLSMKVNNAFKMAKESFVKMLASEPDESKKTILCNQALNTNTDISRLMYKQTGLFACNLSSGSLGDMMRLFPGVNKEDSSAGIELEYLAPPPDSDAAAAALPVSSAN